MAPKHAQQAKPVNKPVNTESETAGSSSRDEQHKQTNRRARGCYYFGKFCHKAVDCKELRSRENMLAYRLGSKVKLFLF